MNILTTHAANLTIARTRLFIKFNKEKALDRIFVHSDVKSNALNI